MMYERDRSYNQLDPKKMVTPTRKISVRFRTPGTGFAGLLTIVFITLKLCHVITWSWIWVLCPLWIGFAAAALFFIGGGIIVGLLAMAAGKRRWR